MDKKATFLIENVGDYHAPRLLKLSESMNGIGVDFDILETRSNSKLYSHKQDRKDKLIGKLNCTRLNADNQYDELIGIAKHLLKLKPDLIFVLGFHKPSSFLCLLYRFLFFKKIVFMSDSKSDDQVRRPIGELIKRFLIKGYDGAQVAGNRHREYYTSLGFPERKIAVGYDVIDNEYFDLRGCRYEHLLKLLEPNLSNTLQHGYVLCVSRFVKRKRVDLVIESYGKSSLPNKNIPLVIVGSGPEQTHIKEMINSLGLASHIVILDNVKNSRMPLLYKFATLTLLLSEYDQWGLCINESLAIGTPAIVSERCGSANEIVLDGINGFVVESTFSSERIAELIDKYFADQKLQNSMAKNAKSEIKEWGLERFSNSSVGLYELLMSK